jgi:peptidoglycan hydrolase CwlO-like protein
MVVPIDNSQHKSAIIISDKRRWCEKVDKTLNLILAEQKRQGDLLHQLINTVAATNVKVAEMDGKISKMDRRITELDGKITEMNGKITELDGKITETNGKVMIIEKKQDSILDEVKEIKATMATKHDLGYYDQMISEHSREIYKLKNH